MASPTEAERLITEAKAIAFQYRRDGVPTDNLLLRLATALRTSEEARVKAERERDGVQSALTAIKPALPVLRSMCLTAGLTAGAKKADEMLAWIAEALKDRERFPSPPLDALRRAEAAETALADMRRERDEAERALLWLQDERELIMPEKHAEAIAAARSRLATKTDGEEKK